jgi:two-component system, OmpR family, sensor kinase
LFKSIRWTLQLWHASMLVLVLASFGSALYVAQVHSTYSAVDHELVAAARVIAEPAAGPHPYVPAQHAGDMQSAMAEATPAPPSSQTPTSGAVMSDAGPANLSVPEPEPENVTRVKAIRSWLKEVPKDLLRHSGWEERDQPYFAIWSNTGSVILRSVDCPALQAPEISRPVALNLAQASAEPTFRTRDSVRELIVTGPLGSTILVGQSVERQEASLQALRMSLLGMGGAVLAVGLLGGFLFSGRVIRPIRLISETAKSISGRDLSGRIDVHDTQSELGSLAETLNETFARLETEFMRQRQFTADASHELRTPLSVILAQCELALAKSRTPEEYRSAIESSLRASTRMKLLVESLLVLARADSGRLELHLERFDLKEAAEECVVMLSPIARQKRVQLVFEGENFSVDGDRACILQVITNLVSNAIRYNLPDGEVCVRVNQNKGEAVLEVMDSGIGIAGADQSRVFQRFFRADNARSRESGGSGLGLAICQSIVRAHGGRISFASVPGAGTTFTARLPVVSRVKSPRPE